MINILITGSKGFLGHHVSKEFLLNNENLNIKLHMPSSADLNLLRRDVTLHYFDTIRPDVILHMAAVCGGILANKNSPADFLHKNLDMASNIFYSAKEIDCKKIYTLGSVCAYPKFCPTPFKEENLWNGYPEETNAPYGMAKRLLFLMGQTYRAQYGFTGAHLIPVNLYGEHDHFDLINSHVIPALINKFDDAVKNNKPYVECWGTGEATREFLYAGDAAQAIVKAVLSEFDTDLPINLGTGKDIPIKDLATLIAKLTGYTGEIIFTSQVSDGQPRRMLDVSRSKEMLNWTAQTDLESGLKKTISWFRSKSI